MRRFFGAVGRGWRRWGPEFRAWKGEAHLFLCAIASALLMQLAFPRWNMAPVAAVGLVPLLWALPRARSGKQAFYLGWVYGAVFYYVLLCALNILIKYYLLIPPAIVLLGLYVGLFKGLFGWLAWRASRRGRWSFAAIAFGWVGLDYLQALGDLGFPWGYLGHSLWRHPALIQLAAWTGVYGLTLILFWINHLLADALRSLRREATAPRPAELIVRAALLIVFILAVVVANRHTAGRLQSDDVYVTDPVLIAIIQPNVDQERKFRSYAGDISEQEAVRLQNEILFDTIDLTSGLVANQGDERFDLIVWPETAVTDNSFSLGDVYRKYDMLFGSLTTTQFGAPIFFGASYVRIHRDGQLVPNEAFRFEDYNRDPDAYQIEMFNSAWLAEPGQGLSATIYHKRFLVPFAEGIPYVQRIKPLADLIATISQTLPFARGTEDTVFELRGRDGRKPRIRFGPLICYESCYPRLSRTLVREGAELLVVITNDAWYEGSNVPAQHELQSIFRAVETRRWVVRCANTGISCFVSPRGEIVEESQLQHAATLTRRVRGVKQLTFYARWGDLFAWLILAAAVGLQLQRKRDR